MSDVDLLAWNVKVSNNPDRVMSALDVMSRTHPFEVGILTEARNIYHPLMEWCEEYDFQVFQERPGAYTREVLNGSHRVPEEGDTAVIVKGDIEVLRHRVKVMHLPWSHDREHDPRRYPRLTLRKEKMTFGVTGAHWETGGEDGANSKAWLASRRDMRRWMLRHPLRMNLEGGDLNESLLAMRQWSSGLKFPLDLDGRGVDILLGNGCLIEAEVLPKYGSDHYAMHYGVTKKGILK